MNLDALRSTGCCINRCALLLWPKRTGSDRHPRNTTHGPTLSQRAVEYWSLTEVSCLLPGLRLRAQTIAWVSLVPMTGGRLRQGFVRVLPFTGTEACARHCRKEDALICAGTCTHKLYETQEFLHSLAIDDPTFSVWWHRALNTKAT